ATLVKPPARNPTGTAQAWIQAAVAPRAPRTAPATTSDPAKDFVRSRTTSSDRCKRTTALAAAARMLNWVSHGSSKALGPTAHITGLMLSGRSEEHTSELQSRENLVC